MKSELEEITRPVVEAKGAFLVDISVRGERGGKVVEIFLDGDEGVTTDLCAGVSRELSIAFDRSDAIHGRYYLVVSSPGTDRPLKLVRQYPKNVGRTMVVKYRMNGQVDRIEGTLAEASADGIVLQMQGDEIRKVSHEQIIEARVKPVW